MNTNHKIIGSALAVLAASTAMIATSTTVGAHSPQRWDICPAADTVPLCEIVRPSNPSGSAGSKVAALRPVDGTAVWTGDTKDHPGYGPVNPADNATDWVDSIGVGCRRVPWPQLVACPE